MILLMKRYKGNLDRVYLLQNYTLYKLSMGPIYSLEERIGVSIGFHLEKVLEADLAILSEWCVSLETHHNPLIIILPIVALDCG